MKRAILSLFVSVFLIAVLFPGLSMGQPKYGGRLVFGAMGEPPAMDPHKSFSYDTMRAICLACNNLVETGLEYGYKPSLATSWEVSADGKEWTFNLRKGVKFHNGREMTAEDIKWNFDRMLDPKTASPFRNHFIMLDSAKVIDRYTVKLILKMSWRAFLGSLTGTPIQSWIIAPESLNQDGSVTKPIGTGPFEFVEWRPQEHVKFKKFKDYWEKGLPYVDEIIYKPIPDETTRLTALRAGDVDVAYQLPIAQVAELMKNPQKGFNISTDINGSTISILFNQSKPPFNNVKVRQAVAYGINKQEMLMGNFYGYGWVVNQAFAEGSPWHCDLPDIVQNKEKAKALLKEAGYPEGLKVRGVAPNSYHWSPKTLQIMQAQLREIGLQIELEITDLPTAWGKISKGDFDLTVGGFSEQGDPDIPYRMHLTPKGSASIFLGRAYDNPQVSALIEQAATISDISKRKGLYCQVVKIVEDEFPLIFMNKGKAAYGVRSNVKGLKLEPTGLVRFMGGGLHYTWLDR